MTKNILQRINNPRFRQPSGSAVHICSTSLMLIFFIIVKFTYCQEKPIHGLVFNGKNSYVLIPENNSLDLNESFTIEFWIYVKVDTQYAHLFTKHQPGINDDGSWVLKNYNKGVKNNTVIDFSWPYKPNTVTFVYEGSIKPLNWFHFAVCYDNDNGDVSFWLNGTMKAKHNRKLNILNTDWPLFIGSEWSYNHFEGYLSEIRLSNIVRYKEAFRPPISHVVDDFTLAYWPCNEGQSDILHDLSPNQNHGKVINATWITDNSF
ncbi:MAG: LamG domain-containing protein [bacterium]